MNVKFDATNRGLVSRLLVCLTMLHSCTSVNILCYEESTLTAWKSETNEQLSRFLGSVIKRNRYLLMPCE